MRVALASLDIAWEDKATNLERCSALVQRAAAGGARLVAFPEMTLTGFTMKATSVAESATDSPSIAALAEIARAAGVYVAFGVVLHGRQRPRNQLVVLDPQGGEAARYAKVHPFSFAGEHEVYEGGESTVCVRVDDVAFGLAVCYDLRFPELFTAMADDADALLVIANWPGARVHHWHALLTARALDTQCFVLGLNRTGRDGNGLEYPLSTRVVGPRGEQIAPAQHEGELEWFDIDPSLVREARTAFPMLRDRRPQVYGRPPL